MKKIVLTTGGFDPLHSGHIDYIKHAKKLGDYLIVGLNSDDWLTRKKGRPFMPFVEREYVLKALYDVDEVISFDDTDDTAIQAIEKVVAMHPYHKIIFANGGDRKEGNVPEETYYYDDGNVVFEYGVGGNDKKNSSSWILDEWKTQKTERQWGYWRVLDDKPEKGYKVKELVIYPGKSLSDQRHFKRDEQWIILEGVVRMETEYQGRFDIAHLSQSSFPYNIGTGVWHCASNPEEVPAHVLEIQKGESCVEEDIERRKYESVRRV
jgi:D-beta-D-heptose 7-phosphate kinase/D-beta-D-heptose 1-phosphate adenosyltransferase